MTGFGDSLINIKCKLFPLDWHIFNKEIYSSWMFADIHKHGEDIYKEC